MFRESKNLAFLSTHEQQPAYNFDKGETELLRCMKLAKEKCQNILLIVEYSLRGC